MCFSFVTDEEHGGKSMMISHWLISRVLVFSNLFLRLSGKRILNQCCTCAKVKWLFRDWLCINYILHAHRDTLSGKRKGLLNFKMKKKYTFCYRLGVNGVQEIYYKVSAVDFVINCFYLQSVHKKSIQSLSLKIVNVKLGSHDPIFGANYYWN